MSVLKVLYGNTLPNGKGEGILLSVVKYDNTSNVLTCKAKDKSVTVENFKTSFHSFSADSNTTDFYFYITQKDIDPLMEVKGFEFYYMRSQITSTVRYKKVRFTDVNSPWKNASLKDLIWIDWFTSPFYRKKEIESGHLNEGRLLEDGRKFAIDAHLKTKYDDKTISSVPLPLVKELPPLLQNFVPEKAIIVPVPFADEVSLDSEILLQIGYADLSFSSDKISISREQEIQQLPLLRNKTTIKKGQGHSIAVITINLTFPTKEDVNELAKLIRQVKKCPFLPIRNERINSEDIDAVAIVGLSLSTVPGFPGQIEANLTCVEFDWKQYFPDETALTFSELFCWPLFKLWCETPLKNGKLDSFPKWDPNKPLDEKFVIKTVNAKAIEELAAFEQRKPSNYFVSTGVITESSKAQDIVKSIENNNILTKGLKKSDVKQANINGKKYTYYKLDVSSLSTLKSVHKLINKWTTSDPPEVLVYRKNSDYSESQIDILLAGELDKKYYSTQGFGNTVSQTVTETSIDRYNQNLTSIYKEILEGTVNYANNTKQDIDPTDYVLLFRSDSNSNALKSIALSGINLKKIEFMGKEVAVPEKIEASLFDTHEFDWVIEVISSDFSNTLAFQQAKGLQTPLVQYLGSSDTSLSIQANMFSNSEANRLKELWDYINNLAVNAQAYGIDKDYKAFMRIENNIAGLMGLEWVIPNAWESSTIPMFPDQLGVSLNLIEFNPAQSKREQLLDLIPKPMKVGTKEELETQQDTFERVLRSAKINDIMKSTEVYPDLELPTHKELNDLIRDMNWDSPKEYVLETIGEYYYPEYESYMRKLIPGKDKTTFVNPDFYVVSYLNYSPAVMKEMLSIWKESDKKSKHVYTGADGLKAYLSGGQMMRQTSDIPLSEDGGVPTPEQINKLSAYDSFNPVQDPWNNIVVQESILQGKRSTVSVPGQITLPANINKNNVAGTIKFTSVSNVPADVTKLRAFIADSNLKLSSPKGGWNKAEYKPDSRVMNWSNEVFTVARETGVDPAFIFAMIHAESGGENRPYNPQGYAGLTQISKADASFVGLPESAVMTPIENIRVFAKLIKALAEGKVVKGYSSGRNPSNLIPVLAGKWNGGQSKSPDQLLDSNTETNNHITRVTNLYLVYRNVYLTKALSTFLATHGNNTNTVVSSDLANKVMEVNFYSSELSKGTNPIKLNIQMDNISEYYNNLIPDSLFTYLPWAASEGIFAKALDPTVNRNTIKSEGMYNIKPEDIYEDNSMFEDHLKYEKRNTLLTAFPAYFISLIDGGRWVGYYRFYDRMFGMFGVSEIEVFKSREDPGHIATVVFSNMYNRLTNQLAETERLNALGANRYSVRSIARDFIQTVVPIPFEEQIRMRGMLINSLLLKAGSRIHIRIGCGSDPTEWPNLFNGTIVEVPTDDSRVKVIAFGDGAELEKEIPVSLSTPAGSNGELAYEVTALAGAAKDPRNTIMDLFLSTSEHTLGDLAYRISRGWYTHNNLFGIENFGRPFIDSSAVNNPFNALVPGINDGEIGVNIYEPRKDPMNFTTAPSNLLGFIWSDSDVMTGISVEDATVWKVVETCRKVVPDFVSSVVPFGMRSTLFYGKPWFPLYYDYDYDKIKKALETPTEQQKRQSAIAGMQSNKMPWEKLNSSDLRSGLTKEFLQKPWKYMKKTSFLQIRSVSSEHNLLENRIAASKEDLYTAAQVTEAASPWGANRETRFSSFKYFDSELWNENIRVKGAKSGVLVKLGGSFGDALNNGVAALPFIGKSLNDLSNNAFGGNAFGISSKANENAAISELKDGLKKMYRGSIVLKGDASYRPLNLIHIMDIPKKMSGLFEVREVVHSFNADSGFTTTLTPDLCVSSVDPFIPQLWMIGARWGTGVGLGYLGSAINARFIRLLAKESIYGRTAEEVVNILSKDLYNTYKEAEGIKTVTRIRNVRLANGKIVPKENVKRSNFTRKTKLLPAFQKHQDIIIPLLREAFEDYKKLYPPGTYYGKDIRKKLIEITINKLDALVKNGKFTNLLPEDIQHIKTVLYSSMEVKSVKVFSTVSNITKKVAEKAKLAVQYVEIGARTGINMTYPLRRKEFLSDLIRIKDPEARTRSLETISSIFTESNLTRSLAAGSLPAESRLLKIAAKGAASANIIKLVLSAIGMDTIAELINRKFGSRKSAIVAPLRINGKEFSAGIEGHRGGVVGDPINVLDNLLASWFNASYSSELLGTAVEGNDAGNVSAGVIRTSFSGLMWILGIQLDNPTNTEMFKFGDEQVFETLNIERYLSMNEIRSTQKINFSSRENNKTIPVGIQNDRIIWETENVADKGIINPKLIEDLAVILTQFGWTAKITAAKRDHTHLGDQSRHSKGNALDIGEINGIPIGNPNGVRLKTAADANPECKFYADKLVEAFEALGYSRNKESGDEKSVLWYFNNPTAGNHFNHIHISRLT